MDSNKAGLALGSFAALAHVVWDILVLTESAKSVQDWIFNIHFLANPFTVADFDLVTAVILLAVAFAVGYTAGFLISTFYNLWMGGTKKKRN